MTFVLTTCPRTISRAIYVIVSNVPCQEALVYLDDVVLFYKTPAEHVAHVQLVFFSGAIDYLGHIIPPGNLEVSRHSRTAIE